MSDLTKAERDLCNMLDGSLYKSTEDITKAEFDEAMACLKKIGISPFDLHAYASVMDAVDSSENDEDFAGLTPQEVLEDQLGMELDIPEIGEDLLKRALKINDMIK